LQPPANTGISKSVKKHIRFMPLISFLGSSVPDWFCCSFIMMSVHQNCAPRWCACKRNSTNVSRNSDRERARGARPPGWRKFAGGKSGTFPRASRHGVEFLRGDTYNQIIDTLSIPGEDP
jgi:hypothetical protein